MMRRIALIAALVIGLGAAGQTAVFAQGAAAGKFSAEQYKKALWMVTRFYGGQRMGEGPNWLLLDHKVTADAAYNGGKCFLKDALDGRNLAGGWVDCGDHVLFGQTFFYSAYMLALAYEMFPRGFHDLYHGKDYSDYAEAGNWTMAGGKPNGTPDLLEELKYATDWIIKATPNGTTFYFQKGNGDLDHKNWVTAAHMSTMPINEGGEKEGSRAVYKNPNDGVMASFAAASLAIMSKIYRKYNAAYADSCLTHAKNAYAYAKSNRNSSVGAGGYYQAHKDPQTVFVTAASEMYLATRDNAYLSDIDKNQIKGSWHVLDYANTHDLAAYAAARAVPADRAAHLKLMLDEFVSKYVREVNGEKVSNLGGGWGQLRYAGNTAFVAALYSLAMNTSQYDQFIYDQMDYVLGGNNAKQSFIVGFCEGCNNQPKLPHHRNVFLRDDNPNDQAKAQMTIPERNKQFGQLMGGTRNSGEYKESVTDYTTTEGGIDYNAGLLGALAYIVSKLAPADTSKFTGEPPIPAAVPTTLQISTSQNPADTAAFVKDTLRVEQSTALYAHVFDQNGAVMAMNAAACELVDWDNSKQLSLISNFGCSYTVPDPAVTPTVKATYSFPGADRPSISKTIVVTVPEVSVRHKTASLTKNGYAMTTRPGSVQFKAADGRMFSSLSIYNMQGKRIFNRTGEYSEINWKSANRPKGMYLVRMTMSNGAIVQRNVLLK